MDGMAGWVQPVGRLLNPCLLASPGKQVQYNSSSSY